ncbi:hypothetical protein FUA26_01065 [Seonamhaeicola algicola]|uniref:Collagen-like protein n=1 Tax=Seonamhaeicola algicola TaxID=1719036 RepID=A0A5C7B2K3_9FLAO|nr:hypothetical protein [Seonamhaeicola algicola]TXE15128.1 hypothetical protein FUA26_01065 [Seonamhaeicola algicola]
MKQLQLKMTYLCSLLFLSLTIACSPEDGADGEQGPQGAPGNANVIMKTVNNVSWTEGFYLGAPANVFEINDPDLNEETINNVLIHAYFKLSFDDAWYPITYSFPNNSGGQQVIAFTYKPNVITVYALKNGDILNASISEIRYFIIEASNTLTSKQDLKHLTYKQAHALAKK